MKKSYLSFQLFVCFLFLTMMVEAQTAARDTAFVDQSIAVAREAHAVRTKKQSPLYNGSQYGIYDPSGEEHPYFLNDDWMDGSIVYSGERFDNISLMYDLSIDKVIAEHYAGAALEMIPEKVAAFSIRDHLFRRITKADDARRSITEGFYEVLYDGKTKIFKRHVKHYVEMVKSTELVKEFEEKSYYYVVKNGAFYSVGTRNGLIKVLGDKKKELKRFGRENHLTFERVKRLLFNSLLTTIR